MPVDDATQEETEIVWRVEMLGSLRASQVDLPETPGRATGARVQPVEQFRTHKAALLLARLALFPHRTHGREELADLLWPDASTERGRANITQTLVYLRQALDDPRSGGLFVADHKTIRLARGRLQTDVAKWEAEATRALAATAAANQSALLSAAIARYTGDLLPGFYDDWVCVERIRLTTLLESLQDRLTTLGAPTNSDQSHVSQMGETPPIAVSASVINAPQYLTRFFGREDETARSLCLLRQKPSPRLLTLIGMGGIGKTRLALEIGHAVIEAQPDSEMDPASFSWAAFVPLAEARTSEQMEGVLLSVIGLDGGGADGLASVVGYLNSRASRSAGRLLLILDNLEQLGDACASVVARLLSAVPALSILATSRQPVRISGEQEMLIGALPSGLSGDEQAISAGVRLFVDRARLMRPGFALTSTNEPEIARLCTLLEGVPLALELAAAWARVLTPSEIADRLNDRFRLLTSRNADAGPRRHRSLHAAIAWSFELLDLPSQSFFAKLSVFRGGWTAAAAQAVTGVVDIHGPLLLLAERSLITVEESAKGGDRPSRYQMLESLREFASEQVRSDDREDLLLAHARYYEELSREADRPAQRKTRNSHALLDGERDNLRLAVTSAFQREDAGTENPVTERRRVHALRILIQSVWIWTSVEAARLLCLAAAALPNLSEEARSAVEPALSYQQGSVYLGMGEHELAGQRLRESLRLFDEVGDVRSAIGARGRLANLACQTGDINAAIAEWKACLLDARRIGDGRLQAAMLNNLGIVCPDLAERRGFVEQAVALDRIHVPDSLFLACTLNTLGNVARELGDFEMAQRSFEEASELADADGSTGTAILVQTSLVEMFLETGENLDRARALLRNAHNHYEESGDLPLLAEVLYLQFRLALAHGDADAALAFACKNLHLSREHGLKTPMLTNAQAIMSSQLRSAGFDEQAERLDALPAARP